VVLGASVKAAAVNRRGRVTRKATTRPSKDHDTRPLLRIEVLPVGDIDPQQRAIRVLRRCLEFIASSYDHDDDAHQYGTPCRCCLAEKALAVTADNQERP
jgi:hypothetical protein